jgi:hypothetical protein
LPMVAYASQPVALKMIQLQRVRAKFKAALMLHVFLLLSAATLGLR